MSKVIASDGQLVIAESLGKDYNRLVKASKADIVFGLGLLREARRRSKKG